MYNLLPGLTVIEQPVQEIGRSAMALLFERLEAPDRPSRRLVLGGTCILRGSTAARMPAGMTGRRTDAG